MFSVFQIGLFAASAVAFGLAFPAAVRAAPWLEVRRVGLAIVFGLFLYIEYYAFGPASYVNLNDEGDWSVALYYLLARIPWDQVFFSGLAGGIDTYGSNVIGMQYVSIERSLLAVAPPWLVIATNKGLCFAIGVIGAYLLARDTARTSKLAAIAIALLFAASDRHILDHSFAHGLGRSLFPLAIYVCVGGLNRSHYFAKVAALALASATLVPTHTVQGLVFSILFGLLLYGVRRPAQLLQVVGAVAMICAINLLNWHEVIYAVKQMTSLTARGQRGQSEIIGLLPSLLVGIHSIASNIVPAAVSVFSLLVFVVTRNAFAVRAVLLLGGLIAAYAVLTSFPWDAVGLGFIKGISFGYALDSFKALFIPLAAKMAEVCEEGKWQRHARRYAAPAILAVAVAFATWFKGFHSFELLYYGGQSQFATIANLADRRDWSPEDHVRVITLRHRQPEPSVVAAFYGLDTFDGLTNLSPKSLTDYWNTGIKHGVQLDDAPRVLLIRDAWDANRGSFDLDRLVDVDLLGVANVGYILSPAPVHGGNVRLVSGPVREVVPNAWSLASFHDFFAFLASRFRKIFDVGEIYVYRIDRHLPRVFAASSEIVLPAQSGLSEVLDAVRKFAPSFGAVVIGRSEALSVRSLKALSIESFRPVLNGYDILVAAPEGGQVVVNAPFLPFWRAEVDGRPVGIDAVNVIQMSVDVPPAGQHVRLRYQRPLLRDEAREIVARLFE